MIKPHGAETLQPLYVSDDAQRAELTREAAQLPSVLLSSGAAASAVMLAIRLLYTAHGIHEYR